MKKKPAKSPRKSPEIPAVHRSSERTFIGVAASSDGTQGRAHALYVRAVSVVGTDGCLHTTLALERGNSFDFPNTASAVVAKTFMESGRYLELLARKADA